MASCLKNEVLILVVLEDGLGVRKNSTGWRRSEDVLILVVLEDGLGARKVRVLPAAEGVLILVVLEDGLGE